MAADSEEDHTNAKHGREHHNRNGGSLLNRVGTFVRKHPLDAVMIVMIIVMLLVVVQHLRQPRRVPLPAWHPNATAKPGSKRGIKKYPRPHFREPVDEKSSNSGRTRRSSADGDDDHPDAHLWDSPGMDLAVKDSAGDGSHTGRRAVSDGSGSGSGSGTGDSSYLQGSNRQGDSDSDESLARDREEYRRSRYWSDSNTPPPTPAPLTAHEMLRHIERLQHDQELDELRLRLKDLEERRKLHRRTEKEYEFADEQEAFREQEREWDREKWDEARLSHQRWRQRAAIQRVKEDADVDELVARLRGGSNMRPQGQNQLSSDDSSIVRAPAQRTAATHTTRRASEAEIRRCPGIYEEVSKFLPYKEFIESNVFQNDYAYVTFVSSTEFVPSAAVLMYSIAQSGSKYARAICVTKDITERDRKTLSMLGQIIEIEKIMSPLEVPLKRYREVFTKLRVWELAMFKRVMYIDVDVVIVRNMDEVFDLGEWSVPMDAQMDRYSTGMMVLEPSLETFDSMQKKLKTTQVSMELPDLLFLKEYFDSEKSKKINIIPRWFQVYQEEFGSEYATYLTGKKEKITIFDVRIHGIHYPGENKPWHEYNQRMARFSPHFCFPDPNEMDIKYSPLFYWYRDHERMRLSLARLSQESSMFDFESGTSAITLKDWRVEHEEEMKKNSWGYGGGYSYGGYNSDQSSSGSSNNNGGWVWKDGKWVREESSPYGTPAPSGSDDLRWEAAPCAIPIFDSPHDDELYAAVVARDAVDSAEKKSDASTPAADATPAPPTPWWWSPPDTPAPEPYGGYSSYQSGGSGGYSRYGSQRFSRRRGQLGDSDRDNLFSALSDGSSGESSGTSARSQRRFRRDLLSIDSSSKQDSSADKEEAGVDGNEEKQAVKQNKKLSDNADRLNDFFFANDAKRDAVSSSSKGKKKTTAAARGTLRKTKQPPTAAADEEVAMDDDSGNVDTAAPKTKAASLKSASAKATRKPTDAPAEDTDAPAPTQQVASNLRRKARVATKAAQPLDDDDGDAVATPAPVVDVETKKPKKRARSPSKKSHSATVLHPSGRHGSGVSRTAHVQRSKSRALAETLVPVTLRPIPVGFLDFSNVPPLAFQMRQHWKNALGDSYTWFVNFCTASLIHPPESTACGKPSFVSQYSDGQCRTNFDLHFSASVLYASKQAREEMVAESITPQREVEGVVLRSAVELDSPSRTKWVEVIIRCDLSLPFDTVELDERKNATTVRITTVNPPHDRLYKINARSRCACRNGCLRAAQRKNLTEAAIANATNAVLQYRRKMEVASLDNVKAASLTPEESSSIHVARKAMYTAGNATMSTWRKSLGYTLVERCLAIGSAKKACLAHRPECSFSATLARCVPSSDPWLEVTTQKSKRFCNCTHVGGTDKGDITLAACVEMAVRDGANVVNFNPPTAAATGDSATSSDGYYAPPTTAASSIKTKPPLVPVGCYYKRCERRQLLKGTIPLGRWKEHKFGFNVYMVNLYENITAPVVTTFERASATTVATTNPPGKASDDAGEQDSPEPKVGDE